MSLKLTLAVLASAISVLSYGQAQNVSICKDNAINADLISMDNGMEQQGFKLVQFQMMNMPSGNLVPVKVTFEKNKMYQLNFIASKNYQQYTFTILDKNHKKWLDKKVKAKDGKHIFTESFAAPESGEYIVVLTQKVKGQDEACGGFSVLKAVNDHLPAGK
jgi:hypothetical protein